MNKLKKLMLDISHCNEIKQALENSNHPCYEIVNYQKHDFKKFQNPEPWNGNIEKADILFIGLNPSYNPNEEYPTASWDNEKIYNYHKNRFSDEHYKKNKNKVLFWQKSRKSASWILNIPLDDITLENHFCITEMIHCKSPKQIGVSMKACNKCVEKWMNKILKEFKGRYIVVFGKITKEFFEKSVSEDEYIISIK